MEQANPVEVSQTPVSMGPFLLFVVGWMASAWAFLWPTVCFIEDATPKLDDTPTAPSLPMGLLLGGVGLAVAIVCFVLRKKSISKTAQPVTT